MPSIDKSIQKEIEQIERFKKSLKEVFGDAIRVPVSARLGWQDENGSTYLKIPIDRTDQPNRYYFHEAGGTGFQGEAFMQPGALQAWQIRYNAPVRIRKDPISGDWEIIGIDSRYAAQFFDGAGANDTSLVTYQNLAPGLLTQTDPASMKAKVLAGAYRIGSVWHYYDTQDTVNWGVSPYNSNIPTTNGFARFVLVQLDFSTGLLSYKYGDTIPSTMANYQAYSINTSRGDNSIMPVTDDGYFRCGYIRLVHGMSRITSAGNIWAIQDYLNIAPDFSPANILDLIVVDENGDVLTQDGSVVYTS
jgi:hypothetical protein